MSSCTTTVPNSVRNSEPVGQTSRQAACVQCLHTSDDISQRKSRLRRPVVPGGVDAAAPNRSGIAQVDGRGLADGWACSMNATCRQVFALSAPVLS